MRIRRFSLIGLAVTASAYNAEVGTARPQWLVTISTDAPVPQFGDRLLVEIVDETGAACSGCRRLFDASTIERWPLSFGVVPDDRAVRIRARLFRAATLGTDGQPAPGTTIDTIVDLGEPGDVGVWLGMQCFGRDADVLAGTGCDPADGQTKGSSEIPVDREPLTVGSWPPAARTPCTASPADGAVCVEGGAFLLGSPRVLPLEEEGAVARPERIVVLSPFLIDTHELTVGQFLALRAAHPELAEPAQPGALEVADSDQCNYRGPTDDSRRDYPLNCLDHEMATAICAAREMRLPTEAEWEFAAGNTVRETTFPWGEDEDVCAHAVVARAELYPTLCRDTSQTILPVGSTPSPGTDVTELGLYDMGGNVSEWLSDNFTPYGEKCWEPALLVDPECTTGPYASIRGGNWASALASATVAMRLVDSHGGVSPAVGLRCVKDG